MIDLKAMLTVILVNLIRLAVGMAILMAAVAILVLLLSVLNSVVALIVGFGLALWVGRILDRDIDYTDGIRNWMRK